MLLGMFILFGASTVKHFCCNIPPAFPFFPNLCSRFQSDDVYKILRQHFQKLELTSTTSGALLYKISLQP